MQAHLKTPDKLNPANPSVDSRDTKTVPPADAVMGNNFMLTHPEAA